MAMSHGKAFMGFGDFFNNYFVKGMESEHVFFLMRVCSILTQFSHFTRPGPYFN